MNQSVSAPVKEVCKKERIGTSGYAARADHKHPLETAIGAATEPTWKPYPAYEPPEGYALDTTTWEAGTNGVWGAHCTRAIEVSYFGYLSFRDYKYSKNGNLIYRGPEYVGSVVELPRVYDYPKGHFSPPLRFVLLTPKRVFHFHRKQDRVHKGCLDFLPSLSFLPQQKSQQHLLYRLIASSRYWSSIQKAE